MTTLIDRLSAAMKESSMLYVDELERLAELRSALPDKDPDTHIRAALALALGMQVLRDALDGAGFAEERDQLVSKRLTPESVADSLSELADQFLFQHGEYELLGELRANPKIQRLDGLSRALDAARELFETTAGYYQGKRPVKEVGERFWDVLDTASHGYSQSRVLAEILLTMPAELQEKSQVGTR